MAAHDWFDRWALRRAGVAEGPSRRDVLRRAGIVGAAAAMSPLIQSVTAPAFAVSCGAGLTDCGGNCVNTLTNPLNCGTCGFDCSRGTCAAGVCTACTPTTCNAQFRNCGTISDGCGNTLNCGTCTVPQFCGGGGTPGQCGGNCTPKTCPQLGHMCGTWSDGCVGTIDCGTCPTGQTCLGNPARCVNNP